jgi:acetylornithine deacetylase
VSARPIEAALAELDGMRDEIVEHLVSAVRLPSVNPAYPAPGAAEALGIEAEVAALMGSIYEDAGLEIDRFALEPGRENCVGRQRGSGGGRSLAFNGHIDVVPVGDLDEWTVDPFGGLVRDGYVWGRGATDMKAGVIAQAAAAIALHRAGVRLRGDLILAAVVGEETGQHELGTSATIERGYRADAAVIAEPSGPPWPLAVVPVTPGLLWFSIEVRGRATHASLRGEVTRPNGAGEAVGVSALDHGLRLVDGLRSLDEEWGQTKRHELFKDGHFTIHPGVVTGRPKGTDVPFFIPDEFVAEYNVTHHPDEDPDDVKAEIQRQIDAASQLDPWLRKHPPKVTWKLTFPASRLDWDHPLCQEVMAAHEMAAPADLPARLHGFAGVADVTWYRQAGIPALIYGPGDLRWAHAPDERVAIEEVLAAARTFAVLAISWCGAQGDGR